MSTRFFYFCIYAYLKDVKHLFKLTRYLAAYERVNRLDLDVEQTEEDEVGLSFSSKKRSVAGSFSALMSAYTTPGYLICWLIFLSN